MRKKVPISISLFVALLIAFSSLAFAATGSIGHYANYSSDCLVRLIPLLNDIVKGYTTAHQSGGGTQNYAYIRARIGENSSNYTQNVSYEYNCEYSGEAQAGWTNSHWAQTYHYAVCYTDNWSGSITLDYAPRS